MRTLVVIVACLAGAGCTLQFDEALLDARTVVRVGEPAESRVHGAVVDVFLAAVTPDQNTGSLDSLDLSDPSRNEPVLMRFDLSSVPAGRIAMATLTLWVVRYSLAPAARVVMSEVHEAWVAGTGTYTPG